MFSIVLSCKCQPKEHLMLRKMSSFFEKTLIVSYPNSESFYSSFIEDFIEENENGKITEIISNVDVYELNRINKELQQNDMYRYFYRYKKLKDFENSKNIPDSIFESFKIKYKYNVVRLSDSFLNYYFSENNSEFAQYTKQHNEDIGEISPIVLSLFLIHKTNELENRKNVELVTLLFWPYLCYKTGLDFYPNRPSD